MGRGIAYPYPYHVLIDEWQLYDNEEERLNEMYGEEIEPDQAQIWEDFKTVVCDCFDAAEIDQADRDRSYNDCYLFGETDRLYLGVDRSGAEGAPCIYLKPKTWERRRIDDYGQAYWEEIEYVLKADAAKGFNKLIKQYPTGIVEFWTSAWTSSTYGKQKDGSFVSY